MGVIDRRSVAAGAVVAAAIVVPASVVGRLVAGDGKGDESAWVFLFLGLMVIGFAAGGFVAAAANPNMPYLHGVAAAAAAFAAVQLVALCRQLVTGAEVMWFALCFRALVAMTFGMVGGIVADRIRRSGAGG